jgi:hypothetical protein
MKKRRVILVVAGCLVLAAAAALLWPREREPRYNGRTLSEWILRCEVADVYDKSSEEYKSTEKSVAAVHGIGTNALPCLLKWIQYRTPPWKRRIYPILHLVPSALIPSFLINSGNELVRTGEKGFKILGPEAKPAIPELMRITTDRKTPTETVERAAFALSSVGNDALAPVLAAVGDANCPGRARLMWAFFVQRAWRVGTNGTRAVPVLIQCLGDKDTNVSFIAASSLGVLKLEPGLVVPALTENLQNASSVVRQAAAASLSKFGDQARSAVPSLINALKDTDPWVRETARDALYMIDPMALETAGTGKELK